jgi:hypothetical protein
MSMLFSVRMLRNPGKWWAYLTPEERRIVVAADQAKLAWQKLSATRAAIVNRAQQRARYAKKRPGRAVIDHSS